MKLTNFKMYPLMIAASVFLALSGCDGTTGISSDSGISVIIPDVAESNVTASPASVAADGVATATVTVTVNDASSNPITNATVTLLQTGSSTISAVTNVGDGTYTFDVNSTTVETVTYTATADGIIITQTANVDFIGLPANITINNAAIQSIIASIFDDTPYNPAISLQGVINQQVLTVSVPYTVTTAPVTLLAYSTSVTLDASVTEDDEAGIVATFAWAEQANLPVGSGTFTATITIDDSAGNADNIYKAKRLDIEDDAAGLVAATFPYATDDAGGTGTLTLKIMAGIPDRMFGIADNNSDTTTHNFLYLPVTNATTGKTWLNNNLGANYANTNSPEFNLTQQATASNDHNAYGSLLQWGRKADGHELITWTDGSTGTGTNGTDGTQTDNPTHALFIMLNPDWRVNPDDTLWNGEAAINAVCPVGYRVPTRAELIEEKDNSELVLTYPGFREWVNGLVGGVGTTGYYFASTVTGTDADAYLIDSINKLMLSTDRAYGMSVRCIKN